MRKLFAADGWCCCEGTTPTPLDTMAPCLQMARVVLVEVSLLADCVCPKSVWSVSQPVETVSIPAHWDLQGVQKK